MKDFLENMEDAAERWLHENEVDAEHVRCSCGQVFKLQDGETLGPNPYAIPVCQDCFELAFVGKLSEEMDMEDVSKEDLALVCNVLFRRLWWAERQQLPAIIRRFPWLQQLAEEIERVEAPRSRSDAEDVRKTS